MPRRKIRRRTSPVYLWYLTPRWRKEVNVRVKVTKVEEKIGQKAKEKVEDGEEKKGEAWKDNNTKEDEAGGKKEGKGKEGENKESEEDRVFKLVMRQNLKALKKGEKEKMAEAEQKQNMMQKDGYTLREPGLNAWVAISNMDQDEVWEEIFPAVQ